jgi:hypothetical protein
LGFVSFLTLLPQEMEDFMLSKRLICLSLVVTTLFVSNRSNAMATPAALAMAYKAANIIICCHTIYDWWYASSPEAIKTEEPVAAKKLVSDQASSELKQLVEKQSSDFKAKIEILEKSNTPMDMQSIKTDEKIKKIILKIKDKLPQELSEKLEQCFQSSCNATKQGGISIYEFTFKNHSHLTITFVAMSAGYFVYKKYGKKIKESIQQKLPDSYGVSRSKTVDMIPMTHDL